MERKTRVAIGLGSNLGDRLGMLRAAAQRLVDDVLLEGRASRVYETPPWGIESQPDFLNAVLVGDSEWKPPAILNYLKRLEGELGRRPGGVRFGPREIDLDLLVYGDAVWDAEGVEVPHPRMHDRAFVLAPLAELWADWRHPRLGRTASQMLQDLGKSDALKLLPEALLPD